MKVANFSIRKLTDPNDAIHPYDDSYGMPYLCEIETDDGNKLECDYFWKETALGVDEIKTMLRIFSLAIERGLRGEIDVE